MFCLIKSLGNNRGSNASCISLWNTLSNYNSLPLHPLPSEEHKEAGHHVVQSINWIRRRPRLTIRRRYSYFHIHGRRALSLSFRSKIPATTSQTLNNSRCRACPPNTIKFYPRKLRKFFISPKSTLYSTMQIFPIDKCSNVPKVSRELDALNLSPRIVKEESIQSSLSW